MRIARHFFHAHHRPDERYEHHGTERNSVPHHHQRVPRFVNEKLADHPGGVGEAEDGAVGAHGQEHRSETRELREFERAEDVFSFSREEKGSRTYGGEGAPHPATGRRARGGRGEQTGGGIRSGEAHQGAVRDPDGGRPTVADYIVCTDSTFESVAQEEVL
mmetsp:Transcript_41194/g.96613  ORF Transcript_41194/g.96613 Transcript_41194/m.96613 type:complete len:161 (-) Transcript_41194:35-517(-)